MRFYLYNSIDPVGEQVSMPDYSSSVIVYASNLWSHKDSKCHTIQVNSLMNDCTADKRMNHEGNVSSTQGWGIKNRIDIGLK